MLEDMVMEEGRSMPDDIGELIAAAREHWETLQETSARVVAALVGALDLMEERRKMPVFRLQERS